jgi:hypothetical protein
MSAMEREFNPYDPNDFADIDKFIKKWQERRLREITRRPHSRPTTDLLKQDNPPQQNEAGQIDLDSQKP